MALYPSQSSPDECPTEKESERFRAHKLLQEGKSKLFVATKLKRDIKWVRRQKIVSKN